MHFSIVIPTLNEEGFIGGILEDLAQQDYTDFEVIHVDGKSEDRTCQIVESCFTRSLRIPPMNFSSLRVGIIIEKRICDINYYLYYENETKNSIHYDYISILFPFSRDSYRCPPIS
jgi:glycosyltransferase involved in cell wall biosynthesis